MDVQYSHLAALGDSCGIATAIVAQALADDNLQRRKQPMEVDQSLSDDPTGPDLGIDSEEEDLEADEDLDLVQ